MDYEVLDNFIAIWCDKEDCEEHNLSICAGRTVSNLSVISARIEFESEDPGPAKRQARNAIERNRAGDYRYFVAKVYRKGDTNPIPGEIVTLENDKKDDDSVILRNGDIIGSLATSQVDTAKILQGMVVSKDKMVAQLQEENTRLKVKLEEHNHLAVIRELADENSDEDSFGKFARDVLTEPVKLALSAMIVKKRAKQLAESKKKAIESGQPQPQAVESEASDLTLSDIVSEVMQGVEELYDDEQTRDMVVSAIIDMLKRKIADNENLAGELLAAFMGN